MIGQRLDGKYEIKSEIGRGGMGVVYGGFDHALKRRVAVKILAPQLTIDPRSVERFRREAVAAASLQHPNIVIIYDVGAHVFGERPELVAPFIVMEYLNGKTLEGWAIQGNGRMPVKQVVHVATQTASALDYAHSRGIVHRDIKPSNIMLSEQGRLTLMDFGLVRVGEVSGLTVSGIVIGTPEYISPEQALGHEADGRSDIYSFGVVVFRLLTGTIPFARATPLATAHAHAYEPAPPLRRLRADLPKSMETVLLKAMAKDPSKRYAESGQFARDLSLASSGKMPPGLKFTLAVSLPGSKDPSPVKQTNLTRTPGLPATLAPEAASARVAPQAANLKGGQQLAPTPVRSKPGSSFRPLLVVVAILLGIAGIAGLVGTLSRSTREASPRPRPAALAEVGPSEQRVAGQASAAGSSAASNTQTPSPTAEFASTATKAPSPSLSPVPGLAQAAALASQSGTATATVTARPSPTALPTSTPVPTSTPTTKPTRTPTSTSRPSPTALRTSTPLATNTPTPKPTLQPTSTPRPSPTANATNTQQPAGPLTPTPRSILYVYYSNPNKNLGFIVSTQPDTTDSPELRIGFILPGERAEVLDQVKVGDVTFLEIQEQGRIPHGFIPYYNTIFRLVREEVDTPPTPRPPPLNQRVVNTSERTADMYEWPGSTRRLDVQFPPGAEAILLHRLPNSIQPGGADSLQISYQGAVGWISGSEMSIQE